MSQNSSNAKVSQNGGKMTDSQANDFFTAFISNKRITDKTVAQVCEDDFDLGGTLPAFNVWHTVAGGAVAEYNKVKYPVLVCDGGQIKYSALSQALRKITATSREGRKFIEELIYDGCKTAYNQLHNEDDTPITMGQLNRIVRDEPERLQFQIIDDGTFNSSYTENGKTVEYSTRALVIELRFAK